MGVRRIGGLGRTIIVPVGSGVSVGVSGVAVGVGVSVGVSVGVGVTDCVAIAVAAFAVAEAAVLAAPAVAEAARSRAVKVASMLGVSGGGGVLRPPTAPDAMSTALRAARPATAGTMTLISPGSLSHGQRWNRGR
jgi:hypothetical protein